MSSEAPLCFYAILLNETLRDGRRGEGALSAEADLPQGPAGFEVRREGPPILGSRLVICAPFWTSSKTGTRRKEGLLVRSARRPERTMPQTVNQRYSEICPLFSKSLAERTRVLSKGYKSEAHTLDQALARGTMDSGVPVVSPSVPDPQGRRQRHDQTQGPIGVHSDITEPRF